MKIQFFSIILSFLAIVGSFGQRKNDLTFSSSEITLKTATGDISGTLTIPNHLKKSPIIIIVAGSGPTDRDGNNFKSLKTNAYKMLSENLAENGISSLRFDKRGVAKSKAAITSENDLRFETYINDVLGWVALLASDKRFSKVDILGHSEGSLIGMIAAEQADVKKFISVAGAGKTVDKILQDQLKNKISSQLFDESNRILDSLRTGRTVSKVNLNLMSLYRPSVQPYMISCIKYDPCKEISKLSIPVLILQGTTDLQVSVNDAKLLSASKPNAKLIIIENMNHVLKESDDDVQKNWLTYTNPDLPLKQGLVGYIVDFIKSK